MPALSVEMIGMVGTRDASEIRGPLVDGPVVDWTDGPVVDPAYLDSIAQAHETAGFDRVLIGYGAVGPEGWAVAAYVLAHTDRLKVLVAHRPGLVAPTVLARQAATLDVLSGGGRVAIHFITGGDEADQRREGDFVTHDDRYRRTGEVMGLVRRLWGEDSPFDHAGEFFRLDGAFSSVKPGGHVPMWFAGASPAAVGVGAKHADVYAFWAEPRHAVAARIETVRAATAAAGRPPPGFSLSLRPIVADTEEEAWDRARWIAQRAAERIEEARRRSGTDDGWTGLGSGANRTYAVERDTTITTSVGRTRLIGFAAEGDVLDERLWMTIARLTGAAGNSTALVGTPEQVAEAMVRYHELGIDRFLLRGFDPVDDAAEFGRTLLPAVRAML